MVWWIGSILSRYSLLYGEESLVCIDKVSFDGATISAGLRARVPIPVATAILSACGSVSNDPIVNRDSISLIETPDKNFPGRRLILGPFWFANHDCNPNCKASNTTNSCAFAIWSERDIAQGDPITVSYAREGTYFARSSCACETCTGHSTQAPHQPRNHFTNNPETKSTRRGGRRERARKKALKAQESRQLGESAP